MNCATARHNMQRDLYGELSPARRASLSVHLARCERCREAQAQLASIRAAMCGLAETSEPLQAAMPSIDFGHRWAFPWRAGLAAAIVALCVGAWLAAGSLQTDTPAPPMIAQARPEPPATKTPDPRSLVKVTFDSPGDVIAVPIETANPNVTIVWIYPTMGTAKAPREAAVQLPPSS